MSDQFQYSKALANKLANLLHPDQRDSCLRTRLSAHFFDLSYFFSKQELQLFLVEKNKKIQLKNHINTNALAEQLAHTTSFEEFIQTLEQFDCNLTDYLSTRKINELFADFANQLTKKIAELVKNIEDAPKRFSALARQAKLIYNQTGIWPLYLTNCFLVGNTSKPTSVNAPILLYEVEIKTNNNSLYLSLKNSEPIANEKLLTLLKRDYKDHIVEWNKNLHFSFDYVIDLIKKITNKEYISSQTNEHFISLKQKEIKERFNGLYFQDGFVLGLYEPQGGALKLDLEQIINDGIDPFEKQYQLNPNIINNNYHFQAEAYNPNLVQIHNPLNIYQKYAIHSALVKNTLIYGPPGTGKSQVIANLIANILANHANCLIVSEKKAALDVLHERLNKLEKLALFLYDLSDSETFYAKLQGLLVHFVNFWHEEQQLKLEANFIHQQLVELATYQKLTQTKQRLLNLQHLIKQLYSQKDHQNHNFNNYIQWMEMFNENQLLVWKQPKLITEINNLMQTNSLTCEQLMQKLTTTCKLFKEFELLLNQTQINELLTIKKTLSDLQTQYLLISKVNDHCAYLNTQKEALITFLQKNNLLTQQHELFNDVYILTNYKLAAAGFVLQFQNLLKDQKIKQFLINHASSHHVVIKQLQQIKEQHHLYVIQTYVYEATITTKLPLIKKLNHSSAHLAALLQMLNSFLTLPKLLQINPDLIFAFNEVNENTIAPHVLLYYKHLHLFSLPYFKHLINDHFFLNASASLLFSFGLNPITSSQLKTIQQIINFEQTILADFINFNQFNFANLCLAYKKANDEYCYQLDQTIYQLYLQQLKNKLTNLTHEQKQTIKQMMQIIKLDKKPNVIEFVNKYYTELRILFPIWISKPEIVSETLPLIDSLFDYGIFDEASQMFLERAVPILYRCKTNIVAGDDKQLQPTNFFSVRVEEEDVDIADVNISHSLLDRSKAALWSSYHLKNHYRSKRADLISFVNQHIYDQQLHFISKNGYFDHGIEVINVSKATYVDQVNIQEAKVVLETLKKYIHKFEKIIVITFNLKQSILIENLIVELGVSNEIYKRFDADLIIVTNLENAQGNEADLVIISNTFGCNENGILRNHYGPLMQAGGINRLNVAITRASAKMVVIKSINASQMQINNHNQALKTYFAFIAFCDQLASQFKQETNLISQTTVNELKPSYKMVHDWLINYKKNEQRLLINVKIGAYTLDFALFNCATNKVDLLICIQSFDVNSLNDHNIFESYDEYAFLVDMGYCCLMINEYELFFDRLQIKELIKQSLAN